MSNIKTIDFGKKRGSVDLRLFDDLYKHLNLQADICHETQKMVRSMMEDLVKETSLDSVDFKPHNLSQFQNGLAVADGKVHGISLVGEDNNYQYVVSIMTEYDFVDDEEEEEEDFMLDENDEQESFDSPEDDIEDVDTESYKRPDIQHARSIRISLIRIGLYKKRDNYRYDFHNNVWVPISYEEMAMAAGYTVKQLTMVEDGKEWVKIKALDLYIKDYGPVSDEHFSEMLKKNKKVFELYQKTSRFTDLFVLDESTFAISARGMVDGGYVECVNNILYFYTSFVDEKIKVIKKTNNVSDMADVISYLFDRYISDEMIALVPLSTKNFAMLFESGEMELARKTTPEEQEILNTYLKYASQVWDMA